MCELCLKASKPHCVGSMVWPTVKPVIDSPEFNYMIPPIITYKRKFECLTCGHKWEN